MLIGGSCLGFAVSKSGLLELITGTIRAFLAAYSLGHWAAIAVLVPVLWVMSAAVPSAAAATVLTDVYLTSRGRGVGCWLFKLWKVR